MKLLWHSNSPWTRSGYGVQTLLFVPRLAELGHEVAISAFHGLQGGPTTWQGHTMYAAGQHPYGSDIVGRHARHFGADWIICLMDQWALGSDTLDNLNVALWMPVDCEPLGVYDYNGLTDKKSVCKNLLPLALTRFGQAQLKDSGFDSMYVPHGLDMDIWRPPADKKALREAMGVDDKFVIFMDAANLDKQRKGFAEQFAAFSRFHVKHPDTLMVVHSLQKTASGLDLPEMAARMGCLEAVKFSDQYLHTGGLIRAEQLRGSYGMADLFSGAALAEGFGLCPLQSLACGVPAVVTRGSAMTEVCAKGSWLVKPEQTWASGHNAWWQRPLIAEIVKAYEQAYARGQSYHGKVAAARDHAMTYDVDKVLTEHWKPALERMEGVLS